MRERWLRNTRPHFGSGVLSDLADCVFNADDRAAELNGDSSASEATLRRIHASSLANLPRALDPEKSAIDTVWVFDNSQDDGRPRLVLESRRGRIVRIAEDFPQWLQSALAWTEQDLQQHRKA